MPMAHFVSRSILLVFLSLVTTYSTASAQATRADKANRGTVGIISGSYGQLGPRLVSEMATVLDEGDQLRIVPFIGRGEISSIGDILYLRGVDGAIVPIDVLEYAEKNNIYPGFKNKINLVCRLHVLDIYLVARKEVKSLSELQGGSVNVISRQHGAFVTAEKVLGSLGVVYTPVFHDQRKALKMVADGEIAATMIVSGRKNLMLEEVRQEDELHIVPIPFSTELPRYYYPVKVRKKDYPNLLAEEEEIETVATTAALVVYNFSSNPERRAKVSRFTDAFLNQFEDFRVAPRHARWRDISLASSIDGWQRYKPVADWLRLHNTGSTKLVAGKGRSLKALFQLFLDSEVRAGRAEDVLRLEKSALFKRFLKWRKAREKNATRVARAPKANRSLKQLFGQFIASEVARIGKTKFRALTKDQLFQRFLAWRKREAQRASQ